MINGLFEQEAQGLLGITGMACEFRPFLAGEGLFSTDYCVALSSRVNRSPSWIASELERAVMLPAGARCHSEGNYLWLDLDRSLLPDIKNLVSLPSELSDALIVVPSYEGRSAPWAYLRVVSLAWQQFYLMHSRNVPCVLMVGSRVIDSHDSLRQYAHLLLEVEEKQGLSREPDIDELLEACSSGSRVFLWLASDSYPKIRFQSFYRSCVHENPARILRCPDANWLATNEKLLLPAFLRQQPSHRDILSLLMYLCSRVPAEDLDLNVPMYEEKSNILWYLSSLLSRVNKIESGKSADGASEYGVCSACSPVILPRLEVLRRMYPYFAARASCYGEMEPFNEVLGALASLLGATLNEAAVRQALRSGAEHAETEIVYSILGEFSAIIGWV